MIWVCNVALHYKMLLNIVLIHVCSNHQQVLRANGHQSWVKECNLPPKIRDSLKIGSSYHQQPVTIYEFGQQKTEL